MVGPAPSAAAAAWQRVLALQARLGAELIETHISWVLLAADTAWKIKRPVDLGFLDFSTLERRRHFCDEELRLNRRLAPGLYLDVVPVTGSDDAPVLGGDGPPIEFALRMRRFAPGALLSERLAAGTLQPGHLDALAARVAALHRDAGRAAADSPYGSAERVAGDAQAVLDRLRTQGADVDALQRWLAAQREQLAPLWQARHAGGWVREGHGDLHLRNAVVLDDGVTAFDCIEFDAALRWIDVQADIGFMVMDLLAHRRADLAWRFVDAWLTDSGDHDGIALLRFYVAYRALVRAMVGRMHAAAASEPEADDYLALARRTALQPPAPRLLVTHGLSGSGKTWATQRLLEAAGAIRLRSDVERKRLHGLAALERSAAPLAGGLYGSDATRRTYEHLEARARGLLRAGWPVIVDAACLRRAERDRFAALAAAEGVPFTLLDCQAAPALLRERVAARAQRRDDASEADLPVLERQFTLDEPLADDERRRAIVCATDATLDAAALAARWEAVTA